ncbi:MAG: phosphotransferase enzyme family protein [Ilumatobacteraceae bacterium]
MQADRPFVDTPPGPTALTDHAARVGAADLGLGTPQLLRSGMNALYMCGDVVLRVGRTNAPPEVAIELAHHLSAAGIPVPRPASDRAVAVGELSVTAWRRLAPTDDPVDWAAVGRAAARLHDIAPSTLPAAVPLPLPSAFPWWRFDAVLGDVAGDIDERALAGLQAAIDRHRGWLDPERDELVVCHGDVHPGNVAMTADGVVLLDWDLLCLAPRGWDHAPMMTWAERWGGAPGEYEAMAAGYGRSLRGDDQAEAMAELRLVAATLMRVRAGRSDPVARAEAGRRLRYWRGEPGAPAWTPQ